MEYKVNETYKAVLQISCYGYDHKPTKAEISRMCWSDRVVPLPDLIDYIRQGYTFTPFDRDKSKCGNKCSNVLFLDIDHSTMSMNEHINNLYYTPTIAYETFNDTTGDHRYRFVYVFDKLYNGKQFDGLVDYISNEIKLNDFDRRVVNQYYNGTSNDKSVYVSNYIYELPYIEEKEIDTKAEPQDNRYRDYFIEDVWNNYWSMSLTNFRNWCFDEFGTEPPYETPYVKKDDERILERPNNYLRIPVKYRWDKELKTNVRLQWQDGENRYLKLWNYCMVVMRMQTVTADELLYYLVDYFLNYINNSDGKYGKLDLVQKVVKALDSDISRCLNSGKQPAYKVDKAYCRMNNVSARQVANKVNSERHTAKKLERYKEIAKWYDPTKTDKENLKVLDDNGIVISRATLARYKRETNN